MKALLFSAFGLFSLAASSLAGNSIPSGTFNGFVTVGATNPGDSGGVKVTTTATGGYTIKGSVAGRSVSVKGSFDQNRQVVKDIAIKVFGFTVATIHLEMTLAMDGNSITGSFEYKGNTYDFTIYRAFYSKASPTPDAGRYTAILPSPGGDYPGGTGYATVTISTAGAVKVVGKLADGATISTGGTVSRVGANDQIPVFNILYGRRGALAGFVKYASNTANDRKLAWIRTEEAKPDKLTPAKFSGEIEVILVRYTAPAKNTVALPGLDMNGAIQLNLTGGNLNPFLTKTGTISTANKLTITSPNDEKVKATISKTTGVVSGSFKVTLDGANKAATIPFKGVILQSAANAKIEGYFLGIDKSGVFKIEAD